MQRRGVLTLAAPALLLGAAFPSYAVFMPGAITLACGGLQDAGAPGADGAVPDARRRLTQRDADAWSERLRSHLALARYPSSLTASLTAALQRPAAPAAPPAPCEWKPGAGGRGRVLTGREPGRDAPAQPGLLASPTTM
ncbi:hypothetical protein ASD15_28295 [Massilia sp. Root351]|nr:hypothetical protein ASD15_28295 [Massilia sp. Root351]